MEHAWGPLVLTRLVAMLDGVPAEIQKAASTLRATTVHYFDIGVRGPGDIASQYHWIYFPEPEFVFYRAGSYSAVHADAAPAGCRSYYVEMSGGAEELLCPGNSIILVNPTSKVQQRDAAGLQAARPVPEQRERVLPPRRW